MSRVYVCELGASDCAMILAEIRRDFGGNTHGLLHMCVQVYFVACMWCAHVCVWVHMCEWCVNAKICLDIVHHSEQPVPQFTQIRGNFSEISALKQVIEGHAACCVSAVNGVSGCE